ncbi:c-type cytochrome [Palleronia abyssalis]|uniref:Cytochrome c-554 n=1 Tax=Palleronia abyssalis TaxID=1501240 RepID=A0A2R8BRS7_9RHOB|nr:cytochrome c [Palleronia abyssalis]SPJ22842.1 Cytochrome c-554 [Palleronia abyssalis]
MKLSALSVAAILAGTVLVQAQDADEVPAVVEARHGIMYNFSYSLSTLGDMAKGEVEYDAELAQAAADRLVTMSDINQTGLWPEGTSSEEIEASRALPAIWENMDDFLSGFGDLHEASMAMAEVAGDGQSALGAQMQGIGRSCGGCHEDYRMSNN